MTKTEERNIKLINKWLNAWTLPGGSIQEMLQCYSNNNDLEVYAPIQDHYVVKKGGSRNFGIRARVKLKILQNQEK